VSPELRASSLIEVALSENSFIAGAAAAAARLSTVATTAIERRLKSCESSAIDAAEGSSMRSMSSMAMKSGLCRLSSPNHSRSTGWSSARTAATSGSPAEGRRPLTWRSGGECRDPACSTSSGTARESRASFGPAASRAMLGMASNAPRASARTAP
jgi:hypothetical protein